MLLGFLFERGFVVVADVVVFVVVVVVSSYPDDVMFPAQVRKLPESTPVSSI